MCPSSLVILKKIKKIKTLDGPADPIQVHRAYPGPASAARVRRLLAGRCSWPLPTPARRPLLARGRRRSSMPPTTVPESSPSMDPCRTIGSATTTAPPRPTLRDAVHRSAPPCLVPWRRLSTVPASTREGGRGCGRGGGAIGSWGRGASAREAEEAGEGKREVENERV